MIPSELRDILSEDPEIMSGALCFKGTRVPVQALLDTLRNGGSLDDFFDGWPGVSKDQVSAVIQWEQDVGHSGNS